jgi:hypothetical protein
MAEGGEPHRPFSDELLEAAARIDELPADTIARLLVKAAVRLRVIQHTGAKLEHIPVAAYHLLRTISRSALPIASFHGRDDDEAAHYLLTRQLATTSEAGMLTITAAGAELGEIADERGAPVWDEPQEERQDASALMIDPT